MQICQLGYNTDPISALCYASFLGSKPHCVLRAVGTSSSHSWTVVLHVNTGDTYMEGFTYMHIGRDTQVDTHMQAEIRNAPTEAFKTMLIQQFVRASHSLSGKPDNSSLQVVPLFW